MKTFFWMISFLVIILFAIHFSLQNTTEVTLRYSFMQYHFETLPIPLFLMIFLSLFLGVLLGGLGDFYKRFQLKRSLRQSQKTIQKLEKEIQAVKGAGQNPPSFLTKEE